MNKKKILVVDDDASIRKILNFRLTKLGYTIVEQSDGAKALNYLEVNKKALPDLIISDIMMPNINGYQFITELKKNPEYKNIPIIVLTARSSVDAQITAYTLGANECINKPFNIDELGKRVEYFLNYYGSHSLKIRFSANNKVVFKIPNDETSMKKVMDIILELSKKFVFSEDNFKTVKSLFEELMQLFLSESVKFDVLLGYYAENMKRILFKLEIQDTEIYKKYSENINNIIKKYTNFIENTNQTFIFEIILTSAVDLISEINQEIKSDIKNVVKNFSDIKPIAKEFIKEAK